MQASFRRVSEGIDLQVETRILCSMSFCYKIGPLQNLSSYSTKQEDFSHETVQINIIRVKLTAENCACTGEDKDSLFFSSPAKTRIFPAKSHRMCSPDLKRKACLWVLEIQRQDNVKKKTFWDSQQQHSWNGTRNFLGRTSGHWRRELPYQYANKLPEGSR